MGYNIIGESKYGREIIDTAKDKKEAEYLIKEYRMAYGKEWSIYSKYINNKQDFDEGHQSSVMFGVDNDQ